MGLFKKKSTIENTSGDSVYTWMTVDEALAYSRGERQISTDNIVKMASELSEQVNFLKGQREESSDEYSQVTQMLTDLQRYERMGEHERADIADAARMIMGLDAERQRYQTGERKISNSQYHTMEMYEDDFPDKLAELNKHEEYLRLVREDMRNLEGEKGSISYAKERAEKKKNFLNKLSYFVIFTVLLIFIILLMLMDRSGGDFTVPFFITGVAALAYIVYYVYAVGECKTESKKADYMMNRANSLLNKVKIKFVNTTSVLDYSYEKYKVSSIEQLRYIWENYVLQREEENRYRKNTQLLNSYTENLYQALKSAGMSKPDAWLHQPELFLNRNELLDFKDAVSNRRNKLKARIDYNMRQQDSVMNEIEALKIKYAGHEDVINTVLSKYDLE